jgi:hypothetical protein
MAVPSQADDFMVSCWAGAKNVLPQLAALGFLAGADLCRITERLGGGFVQ